MSKSAPTYREEWPKISETIQRFGTDGIKTDRREEMKKYAQFAIDHKDKYIAVEKATNGVPWPVVAVNHRRESDCDWDSYLGNGQKLNRRTTITPEGRGPFCQSLPAPFEAFIRGAIDAYAIDGLSAVHQSGDKWVLGQEWGSWPIEKMIYYCIRFNGWGYYPKPSPYAWGGTIIQVKGKYNPDGHYNPNEWDTQPGCAPMLWMIGYLDTSVHFTRES